MAQELIVICTCGQWNRIKVQPGKRGWFCCGKCRRRLRSFGSAPARSTKWVGWGSFLVIALGLAGLYFAQQPSRHASTQLAESSAPPSVSGSRTTSRSEPSPGLSYSLPPSSISEGAGPSASPHGAAPPIGSRPPAAPAPIPESNARSVPDRDTQAQPNPSTSQPLSPVKAANGVLRRRKGGSAIAGLKIETPTAADYVLKLVNVRDGKEELLIYVRRASSFETKVPLGTYKIIGAYGEIWYGEKHLFGPDKTTFLRLVQKDGKRDEFSFFRDGNRSKGFVIHGYDIHLTQQVGGNLETQNIYEEEFRR